MSLLDMIWAVGGVCEYGERNQVFSLGPDFKISNMMYELDYGGDIWTRYLHWLEGKNALKLRFGYKLPVIKYISSGDT